MINKKESETKETSENLSERVAKHDAKEKERKVNESVIVSTRKEKQSEVEKSLPSFQLL